MTTALHSLSPSELRELVEQRDALVQQQLAAHQRDLKVKNARILQFAAHVSDYETRVSDYAARVFDLEFQNKELRRLLFGARRERFVSEVPASQLMLKFEASTADVAAAVEAELEKISYQRMKPQQKKHEDRMELPFRLSERTGLSTM